MKLDIAKGQMLRRFIRLHDENFKTVTVVLCVLRPISGGHLADGSELVVLCSAACYRCSSARERVQEFSDGHPEDGKA